MKMRIAPTIFSEYAETHDQTASTLIFILAPPLDVQVLTRIKQTCIVLYKEANRTDYQSKIYISITGNCRATTGIESTVRQVCLPVDTETAVAVGADEIDVGFPGGANGLE